MKFSVIVPVYNGEKTLVKCLDSLLSQDYNDFELIIVNDGSTDSSLSICESYANVDKRIKVYSKENGGLSSARNLGIDHASGDWILFCDADDCVLSNWITVFAENYQNADFLISKFIPLGEFKDKIVHYTFDKSLCSSHEAFDILSVNRVLGYVWCKAFKRSIIDKYNLRFDPSVRIKEDELFDLSYMAHCKSVYLTNVASYCYEVANFEGKYEFIDSFDFLVKKVNAISKIPGVSNNNPNKMRVIRLITQSLFSGYKTNSWTTSKQLVTFKKCVGMGLFNIKELSLVTKIIYLLPTYFAHRCFLLKSRI